MEEEESRPAGKFQNKEELLAYRDKVWDKYTYVFGTFKFRWPTCETWTDGLRIKLSETEADILKVLIEAYPLPLDGAALIRAMSVPTSASPEEMKVYIRRIRQRLEQPEVIVGIRQAGYAFNPEIFV